MLWLGKKAERSGVLNDVE